MNHFYGFDLGDAESAIAKLSREPGDTPKMLRLAGSESLITAFSQERDGRILLGEEACFSVDSLQRKLRFKSRFLTDRMTDQAVKTFAGAVLGELYKNADLTEGSDTCFYVGCPAGWDPNTRERYRAIFERAGYPPVRIVSESRAALVSACQSKHLQVGYDILSKPVLVVDIGSSTTDFAYISGGKEVELKTAGEVMLGGGIMDEILLEEGIRASSRQEKIRKVFEENHPWKNYCEFAARRLKEKYFSDEEYWKDHVCTETVQIRAGALPLRLRLSLDEKSAAALTEKKAERLGGRSFREVFCESLKEVREKIGNETPELVFLTGGVSKMPAIRTWVREAFSDSVVITGAEPEFAVARGLAYCGQIDEELRAFKRELADFISSTKAEEIVADHIKDLYRATVDVLVEPVLEHAALPVFDRWKSGEIRKLAEVDGALEEEIRKYLATDEARELLVGPVTEWLRPVGLALEEYTVPICVRHNVPYQSLSLTSYLALSDLAIRVEAKDIFAVEEITWTIDTLVSVLVGLLCGGSGLAIISSGAPGIIAGAFLSLIVLVLGKDKMEKAFLSMDIPNVGRKLVSRHSFESRMKNVSDEIRTNFYRSLEEEKNEEITGRMVDEITSQIEMCLTKMAEVVEVPLG